MSQLIAGCALVAVLMLGMYGPNAAEALSLYESLTLETTRKIDSILADDCNGVITTYSQSELDDLQSIATANLVPLFETKIKECKAYWDSGKYRQVYKDEIVRHKIEQESRQESIVSGFFIALMAVCVVMLSIVIYDKVETKKQSKI